MGGWGWEGGLNSDARLYLNMRCNNFLTVAEETQTRWNKIKKSETKIPLCTVSS